MPSTIFHSIRLIVREQITIEDFQDGRRRCCLKIFKMADMAAILDIGTGMILGILNLPCGPNASHQVWAQSDLGFRSRCGFQDFQDGHLGGPS